MAVKFLNSIAIPLGAAAGRVLTSDASGNATWAGVPYDMSIVSFGKGSTRAVGTGDATMGIRMARACTINTVYYRCNTADASGNLVVELRKNGSTVSGTSTTIAAANQFTGAGQTGLTATFAAGDVLTVYITGVGATPGKGLVVDIGAVAP